ncbi:MAG: glycosyltransferase, partial [Candidatus Omnitrophota bacterium]
FIYKKGYAFLVYRATWVWRFLFWLTEAEFLRKLSRKVVAPANAFSCRKFINHLIKEDPDYIITTHFLPPELAAYLKKKNKIHSKVITIITDYGVHPFWISDGTDIYITASGFTKARLIEQGISGSNIKECGIPFSAKFLQEFNRKELSIKLGIKADRFTVLLMTGSFGLGPLEKIAELISSQAQVLVVCANNRRLYKRLVKKNIANVKVFGFVDNAQELMAVSDMIITKPGGSTITELINMELVPVFVNAIPGQEAVNIAALKSYGIGMAPESISEINDMVTVLRNNPQELENLRARIRQLKKPSVCREIGDVIR